MLTIPNNPLTPQIAGLKKDIQMLEETVSRRDSKITELDATLVKERGEKGDAHNILRRKESQIEGLDAKVIATLTVLLATLSTKSVTNTSPLTVLLTPPH